MGVRGRQYAGRLLVYDFPNPSTGSTVIEGLSNMRQFDPTQRTPTGAGYQQRVQHASWVPMVFNRTLRGMTNAEKAAIETHQVNVNYGADSFTWEDEQTDIIYIVALHETSLPLTFTPDGRADQWQVDVSFVQTSSTEIGTLDYGVGLYNAGYYLPE